MKYEVVYTLQKDVTVVIDVDDRKLNEGFIEMGEITSDEDFKESGDPRWDIEKIAFEKFNRPDESVFDDIDNETIINRTIKRVISDK